ncbi:hypothetical protein [Amycolatopsis nigrescens]|uniref:hypothetical protein n=1 Tax=Amycolatopsis nigrescens TaxID=381445 RepID=UPI0012F8ACEA|nr:hypothetical protein [Amycolatopsis nigrescens]
MIRFRRRRVPQVRHGGYRPVKQGARHRTVLDAEPVVGVVVSLLCGGFYRVERRRGLAIYDCHVCEEIAAEKAGWL